MKPLKHYNASTARMTAITRAILPTRNKDGRLVDPREIPIIDRSMMAVTQKLQPERNNKTMATKKTATPATNTSNAGKENSIQQVNNAGKKTAKEAGTAKNNKGVSHNKMINQHNQNVTTKP